MDPLVIGATKSVAYVVTMFGGDGYIPGALTVAYAFRRLQDDLSADIICMVTNDVSQNAKTILKRYFTHVVDIDYLIFNGAVSPTILKSKPHYAKVWTKFQALRLTEYDKICLIDADYLPVKSMLGVFNYDAPAAVTEVPTGISVQNFDFSRDNTYSPEWEDLFGTCCQSGQTLPGIILLLLMYSNNLDTEAGRYSKDPQFTANFYYGGMNASVMLLQPNIFEFRKIIEDLEYYDTNHKLTFFYPEQQYLTVRYAFGKSLRAETIPLIVQEFIEFIDPHFEIFYAKIQRFKNILSKEPISLCKDQCPKSKDVRMTQVIDITNVLTNLLFYYITVQSNGSPSTIGPWTSLGLEYFSTEYYKNNPPQSSVIGYPILQQKKLWTKEGIDLIKINQTCDPTALDPSRDCRSQASNGYVEWFWEFASMVSDLLNYYNSVRDPWLYDKLVNWIDILNYYNQVSSSVQQPA
ncbi:Hypothetical protein HVR_LOCUS221 [uncultured virus]|nr:Hypothetical protein HVR_LOCUS221 [uncultured virus]